MANPKVEIDVALETQKARQALERLESNFEKFSQNNTRRIKRVDGAFSSFIGNLGANAVSSAFSKLKQGFFEATKQALDFNTALLEIQTILPRGAKVTEALTKQLQNLSSEYGTTQQSQAKAFYQVISAGVTDTERATRLLNDANKLATGGLADVEGSIQLLAKAVNVYGEENITSTQAADALFTTVRLGITTVGQLNGALARVLPTAKAAGVSFDEAAAAIAVLTKNGLSTEEATTRLNRLLSELSKRSGQLGKDFQINNKEGRSFSDVLANISKRTGDSSINTNKLFNNVRSVSAALILASDGAKEFNGALDEYANKSGAAAQASDEIVNQDLNKQLEKLGSNINIIFTRVANEFTPAVLEATKALNGLLELATKEDPRTIKSVNEELEETKLKLQTLDGFRGFGQQTEEASKLRQKIADLNQELIVLGGSAQNFIGPLQEGLFGPQPESTLGKKLQEETAIINEEAIKRANLTDRLAQEAVIASEEAFLKEQELESRRSGTRLTQLQELEREKLNIKFNALEADARLIQNSEEQKAKLEQIAIKREIATTKLRAKQKAQVRQQELKDEQSFFNSATSLAQSESNTLKSIGKAAALTQIAIATETAIASSFDYGSRIGGPPLGFTFAAIAAAAQAERVKKVLSLQEGGFVNGGTTTGDRIPVRLNAGEVVLNSRQQNEFMRLANGNSGSKDNNEQIERLINSMNSQNIVVQIDQREVFRAMRNEAIEQGVA